MTKPTKWTCAPSEDSDQPGHPPSLIRVFAVRMKKAWALSYPLSVQRRLWSDWADAQADLSLRWAHSHFVDFVTSRLKSRLFMVSQLNVGRTRLTSSEKRDCDLYWFLTPDTSEWKETCRKCSICVSHATTLTLQCWFSVVTRANKKCETICIAQSAV